MSDPLISIIVITGRPSYGCVVGLEKEHLFQRTMQGLEAQTFRDFELVVGDACAQYRDLNKELAGLGDWTFKYRTVPVGGFWIKNGRAAIQRTINTAAVFANGTHFFVSGDACEYPPHVLEEAAMWIKQGRQPHLMSIYKRGGELIRINEETKKTPFNHGGMGGQNTPIQYFVDNGIVDDILIDSRWKIVASNGGTLKDAPWSWLHNHGSLSREDFFCVNGFDENLDGSKSLQDIEMGSRLEMAGLWRPVHSLELYCYDHDHFGWHEDVFFNAHLGAPRSNFQLIQMNRERKAYRANLTRLEDPLIEQLIRRGASSQEDRVPIHPEGSPERKLQIAWTENQFICDFYKTYNKRRAKEGLDKG